MSVEREVDKVLQKLNDTASHTGESLEDAIGQVQVVARELEDGMYFALNVALSNRARDPAKRNH